VILAKLDDHNDYLWKMINIAHKKAQQYYIISRSVNQSINQSIKRSINRSVSKLINLRPIQSINSIDQSVNQSIDKED